MAMLVPLAACTPISLQPDERARRCRIEVDVGLLQPVYVPNPLSNESGAATGAASGAVAGLMYGPASIVAVPFYLALGAGIGAACADAASRHPSAHADFEKILGAADIGLLKQAAQAELNAPRAECRMAGADAPPPARPDAIVEIEKVETTTECLYGKQGYSIAVHWRVVGARGGAVLAASTTRCSVSSLRSVDDWFADPGFARTELEHLLEKTGRRVGASVLDARIPGRCVYRSMEDGGLE